MAKDKKAPDPKADAKAAAKKPGKDEAQAALPEGEGAAEGKPAKPAGKKQTVMIVAAFLFGAAIVNTMMFFYFRNVRSQVTAPLEVVKHELAKDTLAAVDSLLKDSLSIVVDELVDHVLERNEEVAELKDSTVAILSRLDKLRQELDTTSEKKVELKDADLDRLSRVFGSMQPAKAAPVMMKMDNAAVAGILLSIEERSAAKILAAMPPEKAAEIAKLIREKAAEKQKQAGKARSKP